MDILNYLKEELEKDEDFHRIQKRIFHKFHQFMKKSDLLHLYLYHLYYENIKEDPLMESRLRIRSTRSNSGELEVSTIMPPHVMSCRYDCAMCPNERKEFGAKVDMARSYLSSEGTPKLGIIEEFSSRHQIWRRLIQYEYLLGHKVDKMIHILLGGTFHSYDESARHDYIHDIYYACNVYNELFSLRRRGIYSKQIWEWIETKNPYEKKISIRLLLKTFQIRERLGLDQEKEINENMEYGRVTGIVIETRPDEICRKHLVEMRSYGVTRVQLGVQHDDPAVLHFMNRKHDFEASKRAAKMLKDNGFKVDVHALLDCPATTLDKDYRFCKRLFNEIAPDYVKLYICVDVPFTKNRIYRENAFRFSNHQKEQIKEFMIEKDLKGLERWGSDLSKVCVWEPYAEVDFLSFIEMLIGVLQLVPVWTRIARFHRDFPRAHDAPLRLGYESDHVCTNLFQYCQQILRKRRLNCHDIRTRELRDHPVDLSRCRLFIHKYESLGGNDYFMSVEQMVENNEKRRIIGMIRTRIVMKKKILLNVFQKKKSLIVRELHVYGNLQSSSKQQHGQHQGIGKFLLKCAEALASYHKMEQIVIISGVGVRQYYQKQGYVISQKDEYMIKSVPQQPPYFISLNANRFIWSGDIMEKTSCPFWVVPSFIGNYLI